MDWGISQYSVGKALGLLDESGGGPKVDVFSNVAGYGPLGYLPQITGIRTVSVLSGPPLGGFYLARILNLLSAILLTTSRSESRRWRSSRSPW